MVFPYPKHIKSSHDVYASSLKKTLNKKLGSTMVLKGPEFLTKYLFLIYFVILGKHLSQ